MVRQSGTGGIGTAAKRGVLVSRPRPARPAGRSEPGLRALGLGEQRDGLVFVPASFRADGPAPLLVTLHGAGGTSDQMIDSFLLQAAEDRGFLILSPDSRGRTWDVILGEYGPDVAFLDAAIDRVLSEHMVDGARIAVSGFSDGASYALSIGVINGLLFSDILAFSPGFAAPTEAHGSPRIFICHGIHDGVLPIDACSRRLVPRLREAGYDVDYREFDDGHIVPQDMVAAALDRFLG